MLDHYKNVVTKLQEKNYFCMGLSEIERSSLHYKGTACITHQHISL